MTHEQLRDLLQKQLGTPINDELWQLLEDEDRIYPVINPIDEDETVYTLAEYVRRLHQAVAGDRDDLPAGRRAPKMLPRDPPSPKSRGQEALGEIRTWALSVLLAQEADKSPGVVAFRSDVLTEGLLDSPELESWIKERASEETKADCEPADLDNQDSPGYVEYSVPGDRYVRIQPFHPGGILERLNELSSELEETYPWTIPQSNLFVLTGLAPLALRVDHQVIHRATKAGIRVQLSIDPNVPPREVAEYYKAIRDRMSPKRPRAMTAKHMTLAVWGTTQLKTGSWGLGMKRWNETYPERDFPGYQYTNRRNFRRDFTEARRRLLSPEYTTLS